MTDLSGALQGWLPSEPQSPGGGLSALSPSGVVPPVKPTAGLMLGNRNQCQRSKTDGSNHVGAPHQVKELLTLAVLLLELGLLLLQLTFSSSLFSLDLLSQILHQALLHLHVPPDRRLLGMCERALQLPSEHHIPDSTRDQL